VGTSFGTSGMRGITASEGLGMLGMRGTGMMATRGTEEMGVESSSSDDTSRRWEGLSLHNCFSELTHHFRVFIPSVSTMHWKRSIWMGLVEVGWAWCLAGFGWVSPQGQRWGWHGCCSHILKGGA